MRCLLLLRATAVGVLLLLFMSREVRAQEPADVSGLLTVGKISAPLSENERAVAIRLAEQTLKTEGLLPDAKTILTLVQTHRDARSERAGIFERRAVLTYYRYAGDVGILVYVNLARQQVTGVERLPHFPAPIAFVEVQRARRLALSHPELRKRLGSFGDTLSVEALLTRTPIATDLRFHHRLVYLLFRVGPHYLNLHGTVLVNLTTETVTFTPEKTRRRNH